MVLTILASYVRFMVFKDYLVAYEGECDPNIHSCFVGCSDDECTETYFYSKMVKHATTLETQCGVDITDCENANICLGENDTDCIITYCDPLTDIDSCSSETSTSL